MMPETFNGQCQCGAVRYRATGTSATLFACHCSECQRQSASAFGMALWLKDASIELLCGEVKEWVRVTPSGRSMACRFCPHCGTRLFHQVLGQSTFVSIKPGTLDDTRALTPVGHLWTASHQPWIDIPAGALQYEHNPDSFDALLAAWSAQHD